MTKGQVSRAEVQVASIRSQVSRAELAVTAAVTGQVSRAQISVATSLYVRGQVSRAELTTLPSVVLPASVSADSFKRVALVATLSYGSATVWQWEQTAGPAVVRNGSSSVMSFIAPATQADTSYTFRARALVNGLFTGWTSSTVRVEAHGAWVMEGGTWVPVQTADDRAQILEPAPVAPPLDNTTPPSEPEPIVNPIPTPAPVGDTPTPNLFFKLPNNIRAFARKSFVHYFSPYTISLDNRDPSDDTYVNSYLNADGILEYADNGGLLRDRPLPRSPRTGTDWLVQNAKLEIEWLMAGGHDGAMCDLLGGGNEVRVRALRTAANLYYPGFYVMPLIDANSGTYGTTTDLAKVANYVKEFKGLASSWHLPDGRFVLGAFKTEGRTEAWWQSVREAVGGPTAWVGIFLNYGANGVNYPNLLANALSGSWGYGGDPVPVNRAGSATDLAHSRGQKWVEAIVPQNNRPNQRWWEECAGTETYRASFMLAIRKGAEYLQDVTGNDYSENGHTMPSVQNGHVLNDLGAYYRTWWKSGSPPAILRDAIYVSHRNQFVPPAGGYEYVSTAPMTQRRDRNGVTEPLNIVEVRTFLTAAAEVTIEMGAAPAVVYNAPAGEFRGTAPLAFGTCKVTARRNGTTVQQITTNVPVVNKPVVQDLNYYRWSSLRPLDTYLTPLSHP